MKQFRVLLVFGVLVLIAQLAGGVQATLASPPTQAELLAQEAAKTEGWKEMGREDGILSFKKEVAGSPLVAFRGEGIVDAPIAKVASVILDHERAVEWVDSLKEARLIRMTGEFTFVEYNHVGMPPLVQDRDFLTAGKIVADAQSGILDLVMEPIEDADVPVGKYIRGDLHGHWNLRSIESGTKTYVITEMHADPKGSLPKWIVNLFQTGWPQNTLEALRKQTTKTDLKVIPKVDAVFGSWRK